MIEEGVCASSSEVSKRSAHEKRDLFASASSLDRLSDVVKPWSKKKELLPRCPPLPRFESILKMPSVRETKSDEDQCPAAANDQCHDHQPMRELPLELEISAKDKTLIKLSSMLYWIEIKDKLSDPLFTPVIKRTPKALEVAFCIR